MPTPCPAWCDGDQCREPNPGDQFHQRVTPLPLVVRIYDPARQTADAHAVDGTLTLFTSATDDDEVWLAIELGEHGRGVTVSLESAERLSRELRVARAGVSGGEYGEGVSPL